MGDHEHYNNPESFFFYKRGISKIQCCTSITFGDLRETDQKKRDSIFLIKQHNRVFIRPFVPVKFRHLSSSETRVRDAGYLTSLKCWGYLLLRSRSS